MYEGFYGFKEKPFDLHPDPDYLYMSKVPAAIYIANGYGKLSGISQVKELGNIETPIVLTNTMIPRSLRGFKIFLLFINIFSLNKY